eukprot:767371-Prorocentrum_minimum.AAC.6
MTAFATSSSLTKAPHLRHSRSQERAVVVFPYCLSPSYLCFQQGDKSKPACAVCADGVCICLNGIPEWEEGVAATNVETLTDYVPPVDATPPVLTLSGTGQLAVNPMGVMIMIDTVLLHGFWADAGVTAYDTEDGDLTDEVSRYSAQLVRTDVVTPPGAPYVITYSVSDRAGNAAAVVRRWVVVVNPCAGTGNPGMPEEVPCLDGTCTVGGVCGGLVLAGEVQAPAPNQPPVLTLRGPKHMVVNMGAGYAKCTAFSRLDDACDRGASAIDPEEGDLDHRVLACSPDGIRFRFSRRGVTNCGVDTRRAGVYNVTFRVQDSLGAVAYAVRYVTVKASCSLGEVICEDMVSCSVGAVCLQDLDKGGLRAEAEVEDQGPTIEVRAERTSGKQKEGGNARADV